MWESDHKENWAPKNWSFWIMVLEKTLESPLDSKEIKPVNPKGNQPWIFIRRTDALKLKLQYFGHLMRRANSLQKMLMQGKTEGKMVREHHWLNERASEQTPGVSGGQGSWACCSPRGCGVWHDLAAEQWETGTAHNRYFPHVCQRLVDRRRSRSADDFVLTHRK